MKLVFNQNAVLISAKEQEGKEGNKYWNISIEANEEVGVVSCTEELYKQISSGTYSKYATYRFEYNADTQYKNIRAMRILPDETKK